MLFNDIKRISTHTQRATETGDKGHADCRRGFFDNQSRTARLTPGFGSEFLFALFVKLFNFVLKLLNNRQAADSFFNLFDFAVNTSRFHRHEPKHALQTDMCLARLFGIGRSVDVYLVLQNLLQVFFVAAVIAEVNRIAADYRINGRINIQF